jgi:hypothetical protein
MALFGEAPVFAGKLAVQGRLVTHTGFIAATAADLTFGGYDNPVTVGSARSEWVIVSCWGANGEYLSLSLTNTRANRLGSAPPGLQPAVTHLGILLARNSLSKREEAEYLLMRHRPDDVPVGGIFHPSDGYVRVVREDGDVTVVARGRYAHSYGTWQGQQIVHDICHPAPGYENARAWHMTAVRRPWIGEFSKPVTGDLSC